MDTFDLLEANDYLDTNKLFSKNKKTKSLNLLFLKKLYICFSKKKKSTFTLLDKDFKNMKKSKYGPSKYLPEKTEVDFIIEF